MANTVNTVSQLNGLFKEVYADKVRDLTPEGYKLYNMIPFASADKLGNNYHQPVILSHEQGFTYGGSAGDAFTLNDAIAAVNKDAQVVGFEMVLRSYLSVGAISRSVAGKSGEAAKSAFVSASKLRVENMYKSFVKRIEVGMIYGQAGLAVVNTVAANVISPFAYSWAPGIWAGGEGMPIEIRDTTGAILRGYCNVTQVNLAARTITVDALPGGSVSSDVLYYRGAYGNEFAGLHQIITNSGTLFGINASTYSLWSGNQVAVGTDQTTNAATLSFQYVELGIAAAMEKGLSDEDVVCFINPRSWNNLLSEQAGKRMYDQSYSSAQLDNGARSLKFHSQAGVIEILASIYVKEGYGYIFPKKDFMRIGSRDISFDMPGFDGQFVKPMENANAFEIRCYSDQALFTSFPGKCVLLTNLKS